MSNAEVGTVKTFVAKPKEVQRDWLLVDAENQVLGRLATEVARQLRGKHKPIYTPHVDTGDYVIIVNAEKIRLTGNKMEQKVHQWHSGYPGGFKSKLVKDELAGKYPERVVERAIKGMLPKTKLGAQIFKKLKIYAGPEHPHVGQNPKLLKIQSQQNDG
jgi:large subunit ribosomal protein L13